MERPDTPAAAVKLPLRERMPDYLALFGLGIVGCLIGGIIVVIVSQYSFASGFGYTMIGLGVLLVLSGGVSGGGYANLGAGALGTMFGSGLRNQEGPADEDDPEALRREVFGRRRDPRERLRRGLRPEANPRAFWQVIGGSTYFALGTVIVLQFAS